jgi:hypothetical protein
MIIDYRDKKSFWGFFMHIRVFVNSQEDPRIKAPPFMHTGRNYMQGHIKRYESNLIFVICLILNFYLGIFFIKRITC